MDKFKIKMMNTDNIIEASSLNINFKGTEVLNNIAFQIKKGECIGILGKSGVGKTSLLNALANFIDFEGELKVMGNVGFCFQNYSLFPWMTVEENIKFGLHDKSHAEKSEAASAILHKIGLENSGKKYPFQLSGGQMQRVSLARTLINKPSIILLDEPFSALDLLTRDSMTEWLLNIINEYDATVLMVTHYLDEAILFSDRIFVIQDSTIKKILTINFNKQRTQELKFTDEFKNYKQILSNLIN